MKVVQTESNREKYNKIREDALENITAFNTYWSRNIDASERYARFVDHQQWQEDEINDYDNILRKPRLTMNKLQPHVMQLVGEQRQTRPGLEVVPDNWQVEQSDIDMVQNIYKSIEQNSDAEKAYDTAFENQLKRGYGAIEVATEYENPASFNQVIKVKETQHPTQIFFDPNAKDDTKYDGDFIGDYEIYTKKDFKNTYPKAEPVSFITTPTHFNWTIEDTIIVARYFVKEKTTSKICLMEDGTVMDEKDAKAISPEKIKRTRKTEDYTIKCYKMSGQEVLEEYEWPSKYFPLVYADGYSYWIDGEQYINPYIRHAIDAQRKLNYAESEEAYLLKKSHGNKWLMTPSNLIGLSKNNENRWKNPEANNVLTASPDPITGQMPAQIPPTQIPPALTEIKMSADQNIESILGRYGPSIGEPMSDRSGKAIFNTAVQSNLGSSIYKSNNDRARFHVGRIILDLIPSIIDTERTISVDSQGETPKTIELNKYDKETGKIKNNTDVAKKLSVKIVAGSSFAMQKKDNFDTLMKMITLQPQSAPILMDLAAENLELENMPQIVKRIRNNIVPPQVLAKEEGRQLPPPPPNPAVQAQLADSQAKMAQAEASKMEAQADMIKAQAEIQQLTNPSQTPDPALQSTMIQANAEVTNSKINQETEQMKIIHDFEKNQLQQENKMFKKMLGIPD